MERGACEKGGDLPTAHNTRRQPLLQQLIDTQVKRSDQYDTGTMAAMGRYAGQPDTTSNGRRSLPDSRRTAPKTTNDEYSHVPLEEALADLRATDKKLRALLQRDKERMNMSPKQTKSKLVGSNFPESRTSNGNRAVTASSELTLHVHIPGCYLVATRLTPCSLDDSVQPTVSPINSSGSSTARERPG
jgi:hypothetical protein